MAATLAHARSVSAPRLKDDLFVGRYHVIRELGRGGMGTVDLAYQVDIEREVALKRILPRNVGLASAVGWFKREYKALAAIRHPGVPAVYDCGRCDDPVPYFTMERIDGPSLADALKVRRFEPVEALTIAIELGRILAAAHAAGIVHRDVKPANIILEAGGRVRLIDFGICFFLPRFRARQNLRSVEESDFVTGSMEIAGSQGYTDPAILSGAFAPSTQSDVFSVSAVLYEMLTGRRLYDDKAMAFRAVDSGEVSIELAPAVAEVRRGSQPLPKDRHASMDELIRGLEIARSMVLRAQSRPVKSASAGLLLGLSAVHLAVLITGVVLWTAGRAGPPLTGEVGAVVPAVVEPPAAAVEPPAAAVESPAATVESPAADPGAKRLSAKKPPEDMPIVSQALVSRLAADKRHALRGCLESDDVMLEVTAESGRAKLLRVEWETYDPHNGMHRCFVRVLDTIRLPRRGPSGPYHLTIGK